MVFSSLISPEAAHSWHYAFLSSGILISRRPLCLDVSKSVRFACNSRFLTPRLPGRLPSCNIEFFLSGSVGLAESSYRNHLFIEVLKACVGRPQWRGGGSDGCGGNSGGGGSGDGAVAGVAKVAVAVAVALTVGVGGGGAGEMAVVASGMGRWQGRQRWWWP